MYDFGVIGNCQVSALVAQDGAVKWLCFPRPDSPPVFGSLLDPEGGYLCTSPINNRSSQQYYLKNTNILQTVFDCGEEGGVVITDFCPRFEQHGRMYRPASMFRIIEPKSGNPRIKLGCRPVNGWTKEPVPAAS